MIRFGKQRRPPGSVTPRALDRYPQHDTLEGLLGSHHDGIHFPDLAGRSARPGWLDPEGLPYILMLRNAVVYPRFVLATDEPHDRAALPPGMASENLHLVVAEDGAVVPDSFAKSRSIPTVVRPETSPDGPWSVTLPPAEETWRGTHLFAEMIYAHFGHAITDSPSRLWPLGTGMLRPNQINGVLALGMMGTGPRGQHLPGYARAILEGLGAPGQKLRFADRPVRVSRLLIARRLAPYLGLMRPAYNVTMHRAGATIAARAPEKRRPDRIWLSRSRLTEDPREGAELAALDEVFEQLGFAVIHPQELPLPEQIALVRGARHMAGPIGSQLHLCAFSDRPGLRVFSIGPDYFRLEINNRILRGQGGDETHFLIPQPRPPRGVPRHRTPWGFPAERISELRTAVRDWLG